VALVLLVYLDPYHLGDPLFLQRFGPAVKGHEGPLVLVHGSGEAAERALEAQGRTVERVDGVLRVEEADRPLVERAARDLNRRIVDALGVSAVRVVGSDRGLLRRTPGGGVAVGRADWLRALLRQRVVPVVATLAVGEGGGAVEAPPGVALVALARALGDEEEASVLVVLTSKTGSTGPEAPNEDAGREVARMAGDEGVRVRLAQLQALRGKGLPEGVDLAPGA
jgi:hypothetical protein